MIFSEVLRVTQGQLHWSPNGKLLGLALTARLEVRDGSSLDLLNTFNCAETIQKLEWSPDSSLVLTANIKQGIIEVWQPSCPSWRCKIDEGAIGLIKFCWAPDSRHILTTAEFHLRITVWSLTSKTVSYIKYPKEASPGLDFSQDGDYLAVVERRDCKDFISIFETKSWHFVKNFEVGTQDLAGVKFSPDSVLAVWDSPIEYRILIYNLLGQCLTSYSAYQWALGIRRVAWSPSSQFLAIGSFDQTIRIMNHITWKILSELVHTISLEKSDVVIYKEVEKPLTGYPATLASIKGLPLVLETSYEEVTTRPIKLEEIPNEDPKIAPKIGVCALKFSSDGRYFASRVENIPNAVWIWNVSNLSLHSLLIHCNSIKDMAWSSRRTTLAMCTGGSHVYMWSPFGCATVAIPNSPFLINNVRWNESGSQLALLGKSEFSILFLRSSHNIFHKEEEIS